MIMFSFLSSAIHGTQLIIQYLLSKNPDLISDKNLQDVSDRQRQHYVDWSVIRLIDSLIHRSID